jgi:hypothetical protein
MQVERDSANKLMAAKVILLPGPSISTPNAAAGTCTVPLASVIVTALSALFTTQRSTYKKVNRS